jgi:hypothetical protein
VTLKGTDRPLTELIDDFNGQTGQRVTLADLPPDARATVSIENQPCWTALDAICRAHGRAWWRVRGAEITVRGGAYRDYPRVIHDQFVFLVERIETQRYVGSSASTSIVFWLLWPAGAAPDDARMEIAELVDDTGQDLHGIDQHDDATTFESYADVQRRVARQFWHWVGKDPAEGATRLARFTGTVTCRLVLSTRRILSIEKPADREGPTAAADSATVTVRRLKRAGDGASAIFHWSAAPGVTPPAVRDFALRDAKGAVYRALGYVTGSMRGATVNSSTFECRFLLPADAEIAAMDLLADEDIESVKIPFDFSGTRVR